MAGRGLVVINFVMPKTIKETHCWTHLSIFAWQVATIDFNCVWWLSRSSRKFFVVWPLLWHADSLTIPQRHRTYPRIGRAEVSKVSGSVTGDSGTVVMLRYLQVVFMFFGKRYRQKLHDFLLLRTWPFRSSPQWASTVMHSNVHLPRNLRIRGLRDLRSDTNFLKSSNQVALGMLSIRNAVETTFGESHRH